MAHAAAPAASATAEHPVIGVPRSVNITVPPLATPVTVAVYVTWSPGADGFFDDASAVDVAVNAPTCCGNGTDSDDATPLRPPNDWKNALTECGPGVSKVQVHVAWPVVLSGVRCRQFVSAFTIPVPLSEN